MLSNKQYFSTAAAVALILVLSQFGYSQNETKCEPNDTDCPKAEKEAVTDEKDEAKTFLGSETNKRPAFVADKNAFLTTRGDPATKSNERIGSPAGDSAQQTPEQDAQALARKLANPVAALISLPFQNNFDFGMGPDEDGFRYTLNVQPVIPITLNKDWNLISRTIVPIIGQTNVVGTSSQFGLGDTVQAFFFSPSKSEPFVWGLGPQMLIPTATNEYLGTQKVAAGPTGLILKQKGQWTVGALVGHLWSFAGKDSRADFSTTNIQPFLSYTTKTAWTFSLNTESTYEWKSETWNVPIHLQVTKLVKFGKQPVSVGGGLRCWAASGPGGPQWCGFRILFTPLFPKK